jgi:hypothetical protein
MGVKPLVGPFLKEISEIDGALYENMDAAVTD